jgi:hypothetical protein
MVIVEMKLHMNKDGEMEVQQVMEIDVLHVQSSPKNGPTMFWVVTILVWNVANNVFVPFEDSNSWPKPEMPLGFNACL